MKSISALVAVTMLSLAGLVAGPANSQNAVAPGTDFPKKGTAQFYESLPGVKPPARQQQDTQLNCEQIVVYKDGPFEPTNGPRYDTLNRCSRGSGTVIESPQLPTSTLRQQRGLGY